MKLLNIIFISILLFVAWPGQAATISHLIQSPGGKQISLLGNCHGDQITIELFSATSTFPFYSSNAACMEQQYSLNDDLARWLVPDGIYRLLVTEKDSWLADTDNEQLLTLPAPPSASLTLVESMLEDQPDEPPEFSALSLMIKKWLSPLLAPADLLLQYIKTVLLAAVHIFTKELVFAPNGTITVPAGQNQISGSGTIRALTKNVTITNTLVNENSKILITPISLTTQSMAVTEKANESFTVAVPEISDFDIRFDWVILNTYKDKN